MVTSSVELSADEPQTCHISDSDAEDIFIWSVA